MTAGRILILLFSACLACTPSVTPPPATSLDVVIPSALAPNLTTLADGNVLLTALQVDSTGHRFVVLDVDAANQAPVVIAGGGDFFANWADVPGLVEAGDGSLIAHWLRKSGPEVYDYGIRLARSTDGGETWVELGWLNDDAWEREDGALGEHGFISWIAEDQGVRAFWLDGRAAAGHGHEGHGGGAMQLRTATVVGSEVSASELLDERVCDCCPTAAVATSAGPLVAFRDRSEGEIRDVHLLRQTDDGWQRAAIDNAGWEIAGCPVNGPALAAEGDLVLATWYTAQPSPRVLAAWSDDGGATFDVPQTLTSDTLGRVTATILDGVGYVAWLSAVESGGDPDEKRLPAGEVRMVPLEAEGAVGIPIVLSRTAATRRAGVPRLAVDGDQLGLAWTVVEEGEGGDTTTQVAYRRYATEHLSPDL